MTLDQLNKGQSAIVTRVNPHVEEGGTDFSHRLMELGFVDGEAVTVLAKGFWSGEPIAVRVGGNVGGTTFALRRFEAAQIAVTLTAAHVDAASKAHAKAKAKAA